MKQDFQKFVEDCLTKLDSSNIKSKSSHSRAVWVSVLKYKKGSLPLYKNFGTNFNTNSKKKNSWKSKMKSPIVNLIFLNLPTKKMDYLILTWLKLSFSIFMKVPNLWNNGKKILRILTSCNKHCFNWLGIAKTPTILTRLRAITKLNSCLIATAADFCLPIARCASLLISQIVDAHDVQVSDEQFNVLVQTLVRWSLKNQEYKTKLTSSEEIASILSQQMSKMAPRAVNYKETLERVYLQAPYDCVRTNLHNVIQAY